MVQAGETWRGHYPITSFVLQALITKAGESDNLVFTRAERVLFIACSFWAASAKGALDDYLGPDPVGPLNIAREAFQTINAVRLASLLRLRTDDWQRYGPSGDREWWVRQVEDQVAHIEEDVDELIARFAAQHMAINLTGE